jgi:hypothetical protein
MLILELQPKKMSGRWGDRPLGRGGWRVLQPEVSSQLPRVPLRSRAAERHRGKQAETFLPPEARTNSRLQLPFCPRRSLPSIGRRVHSRQYFPVPFRGLCLVPMYLRRPFAALVTLYYS